MHVLITGGTGFIGSYLIPALLNRNDTVTIVTRSRRQSTRKGISYVIWSDDLSSEVSKSDVVINLAGSNLFNSRWNDAVKREILDSRINATRSIVQAIHKADRKPRVLFSGSAVGYYGSRGSDKLTEESSAGDDFLAKVCIAWEAEAQNLKSPEVRLVIPRMGIVQQKDDGALKKMLLPFKLYGGGPIGSGDQYYPWIHMDDVIGIFLFIIENEEISGPVNFTAPQPVTMNTFAKTLGEVMSRPSWFPVPEFALRIAVGEAASSIVSSHRVIPEKLKKSGYTFLYYELKQALNNILK